MARRALTFLLVLLAACAHADEALYRHLISLPQLSSLKALYGNFRGSRLAASPGEAAAFASATSILRQLGKVHEERFEVTVPHTVSATLACAGKSFHLSPLWPNLVSPNTCSLSAPLIDGRSGSLEDLKGQQIVGSVVLLDFPWQDNWTQAAALGAAAILFVEPEHMTRQEAEAKFLSVPLRVPRFLLSRSDASALRPLIGQRVSLESRQSWVNGESKNVVCDIPGSDPALAHEPVLVWAYADAMSICPDQAPGAEQAAGAVAMLELARTMAARPHRRPLRFVLSGAHCLNLQGAREYVERHLADADQPIAVVTLDLSTDSRALGEFGRGYAYDYRDEELQPILPLCRVLRHHAEALTPMLGESSPRVVLTDGANHSDSRTWKNNIPGRFAFDCEPFLTAGYNAITFATVDDERARVDTPQDTVAEVNLDSLLRQVQVLTVMLHHLSNDRLNPVGDDALPLTSPSPSRLSLVGGFGTVSGYAALYEPAKSLVPDTRVDGTLAVRFSGKKTLMGVRADDVQLTGARAEFKFLGVPPLSDYAMVFKPPTNIAAYHLSEAGDVDFAPDEGAFGAENYPLSFQMKTAHRSSPVVMFPCVTVPLFGLADPQDLQPLSFYDVIDPKDAAPPRSFGLAFPYGDTQYWAGGAPSAALFLAPHTRYQLMMSSAQGQKRMLLTGSTPANEAGAGYGSNDSWAASTSLRAATDLCAINAARVRRFQRYRMVPASVLESHQQALAALTRANAAWSERDWPEAERQSRAAWALALRAHPILQRTVSDVVIGVILYSFLLIPFSLFLERLLFAHRKLALQLLAAVGIFVVSFLTLRFVHSAFDLVSNPAMIFVGFVMGALSLLVIAFIVGKFESSLRDVKQAATGVRDLDIRRSNVAMAAFSLGISNLRRRKTRTMLTVLTLVVMTFIVLSFTSIQPDLQLNEMATGKAARYPGLLLRNPGMEPLDSTGYGALANELSGRAAVGRRVYSHDVELLTAGAAMSLEHAGNWADANAMEGFDAEEAQITRPQEALVDGRWFRSGERRVIILPNEIADKVAARVGDTINFLGGDYQLVGIFDPKRMAAVRDLDGESIMPPDFSQAKKLQLASNTQTRAFRPFQRLDPSVVIMVPAQTALDLRGDIRSVAASFRDAKASSAAMASLMPRLRLNLYGGVDGPGGLEVRQFSILQGSRTGGLALVLIQLGIAAMFVLNTMIASVYERTKEIAIFSAIGLAPNHIANLFFAESLVYGVLGAVFGYFISQGVAKWIVATGAFPELTLNFSSSSALMSIALVIAIVLLSTIYPARKAAQIAAPAQAEETLASEPEGDLWQLPLPFSISEAEAEPMMAFLADWLRRYEEYTIGDFVTSATRLSQTGDTHRVEATAWLAPYDVGVSQELRFEAKPSPITGVYVVDLTVTRLSGESKNWVRVNRRFLDSVRRQFLRWRTLDETERAHFIVAASSL